MNICTPGNCICDAREWEGDTDCFGNTEKDDAEMRDRISGREPYDPNFWSPGDETEFPVRNRPDGISGQEKPVSIGERRRKGDLRANRGVHYRTTTDEVLRNRAQKAAAGPVENEQAAWEVEAMEYFKDRLDEIHESMVRAFSGVMAEQNRLHTRIDALVELVSKEIDERSESRVAVEPKVVVTLENVPADVAEELQAELDKRVERIMARRAQHSDSC